MNTLIGIFLVLGVMILVHEWGHFVVARLFGVRVDVFSIGFGPRLFGIKRGATDYRISALPLGGYVRMAGQDLSEIDSNDVAPTGGPDELMSKPRWQRALISFAGPAVNLIMPVILLAGFFAVKGLPYPAYLDKPLVLSGIPQTSPLAKVGVADGDKVVSVNDVTTPTWSKLNSSLLQAAQGGILRFQIDHQGTQRTVEIKATDIRDTERALGNPPIPALVRPVDRGTPASRGGLLRGDLVVSVNGAAVHNWFDFYEIITHSNGQVLNTVVKRKGSDTNLTIHPVWNRDDETGVWAWRIGVVPEGEWAFKPMTFTASVKEASDETLGATAKLFGVMGRLFSGKLSVKQLRSFVGIAAMAGQAVEDGPVDVITMMAMISRTWES